MRGFAAQILVLVIAIAAVLGGYYLIKNKPVSILPMPYVGPAKNNQDNIYTDKDNLFQFKYDEKSKVINDSEEQYSKRNNGDARKNFAGYVGYQPPKLLKALSVVSGNQTPEQSSFSIWIFDNSNKLNGIEWFNKFWYYPFLWGVFDYTDKGHVYPSKQATISGQLTNFAQVSYQEGKPKYFYLPKDDQMFLIRVLTKDDLGEKILSTFKFTK